MFFENQQQPELSAYLIQHCTRHGSKGQLTHRLLSAFLHGPIGQAGIRLRAVFQELFLLIDTRERALRALQLFMTPAAISGSGHGDLVSVSDDQLIGLVQEMLVFQDRIDKLAETSPLRQIAVESLELLAKQHKDWTPARSQTSSASALPDANSTLGRRNWTPLRQMRRDAQGRFTTSQGGVDAPSFSDGADEDQVVSVSSIQPFSLTDPQDLFLSTHASLPAVPYFGGFGEHCWFRTPEDLLRIPPELQKLDSVMDPLFFSAVGHHTETPAPDMMRANWLIQAIAVAQSLQRTTVTLGDYLDSVHLVVQNFDILRGDFPIEFLHQLMSTLVLWTLEHTGVPAYLALVTDFRRRYGGRVDVNMMAQPGEPLIVIRPSDPRYNNISQLLLDLRGLVPPVPLVSLSSDTKQVLTLAAFTPSRNPRTTDSRGRRNFNQHFDNGQQLVRTDRSDGSARGVSLRSDGNKPRYLGQVPQLSGQDSICWYCDGLLRTARRFYAHTADKHAPAFVPDTADHSFRSCKLFRAHMLEQVQTILRPPKRKVVRFTAAIPSVLDFGEISSEDSTDGTGADSQPLND